MKTLPLLIALLVLAGCQQSREARQVGAEQANIDSVDAWIETIKRRNQIRTNP